MPPIQVRRDAVVLLLGISGSGKSTFARRHFRAHEILSSDAMRALVAGDEADQAASRDAFEVLHEIGVRRLRRGLLTVVDATNLSSRSRQPWLAIARRYRRPVVAIVLDVDPRVATARNAARAERVVRDAVIDEQLRKLDMAIAALPGEGFAAWHLLRTTQEIDAVEVVRA